VAVLADKIAGEDVLVARWRERDFPMTIVRPSLTYDTHLPIAIGGWGCATLIDRLRSGRPIIVHGDGTSLWTVTHAEDFAKAFLGLLGHPAAIGEAFHITSDEVLTWDRIYQSIADAAGAEPHIVHIPPTSSTGSTRRSGPASSATRPTACSSTTRR